MTALAASAGLGVALMAVPTQAFAIPVGGWCYSDSYDVQSVNGDVQTPLIPTRSFQNDSASSTVTWNESYTNSTTYTSTYSTTTSFQAGVDLSVIKVAVNYSQTKTTTESITVTTTSSFSAPVPPHTTAWATYGTYKLQTSGIYSQTRYACEDSSFPTTTTNGTLTAYSLTSVGWHYWDSNGSTQDL